MTFGRVTQPHEKPPSAGRAISPNEAKDTGFRQDGGGRSLIFRASQWQDGQPAGILSCRAYALESLHNNRKNGVTVYPLDSYIEILSLGKISTQLLSFKEVVAKKLLLCSDSNAYFFRHSSPISTAHLAYPVFP
jgi:hypothetical protein